MDFQPRGRQYKRAISLSGHGNDVESNLATESSKIVEALRIAAAMEGRDGRGAGKRIERESSPLTSSSA